MDITATVGCVVLAVALSACSGEEPERDDDGNVTAPAEAADVFDLQLGDCTGDVGDATEVTTIDIVPCDEAHDQEVYAVVDVPGGDFPGADALRTQAETDCAAQFETFVGVPWQDSALDFTWLEPTQDSWERDDRQLVCLVIDPAGPVAGSLGDANR